MKEKSGGGEAPAKEREAKQLSGGKKNSVALEKERGKKILEVVARSGRGGHGGGGSESIGVSNRKATAKEVARVSRRKALAEEREEKR